MNLTPESTLEEVGFRVCTALSKSGITAVLTGGSAATYHAPDSIHSFDLDFVIEVDSDRGGEEALRELGYEMESGSYVHRENAYVIEFPPGPLSIGKDRVRDWDTARRAGEILHVLTPSDSCRDRLAHFLFWDDWRALNHAVIVARKHHVGAESIRAWCESEGQLEKYRFFEKRLRSAT